MAESRDQGVNLGVGVVEGEGGPGGRRHAEEVHDRHGAVMAGAYRHPFGIQDRAEVVGMHALDPDHAGAC